MAEFGDQASSEASGATADVSVEAAQKEWPENVIEAARAAAPAITGAVSEAAEFLLSGPFLERQVPPGELAKLAGQLLDDMIPPSLAADDAAEDLS